MHVYWVRGLQKTKVFSYLSIYGDMILKLLGSICVFKKTRMLVIK